MRLQQALQCRERCSILRLQRKGEREREEREDTVSVWIIDWGGSLRTLGWLHEAFRSEGYGMSVHYRSPTHLLPRLCKQILVDIGSQESLIRIVLHQTEDVILQQATFWKRRRRTTPHAQHHSPPPHRSSTDSGSSDSPR